PNRRTAITGDGNGESDFTKTRLTATGDLGAINMEVMNVDQSAGTFRSKPEPSSEVSDELGCRISPSALLRVLRGVSEATKTPTGKVEPLALWISSKSLEGGVNSDLTTGSHDLGIGKNDCQYPVDALRVDQWHTAILNEVPLNEKPLKQLASLALSVAFLREKSRGSQNTTAAELDGVWRMIHDALHNSDLMRPLCSVSRSAQGFLSIPLCSLLKDGNIDELFRLHVWLPDGQRGQTEVAIHSHQPFTQSWVLAGTGIDRSYVVSRGVDPSNATHSEYEVAWNDGKDLSKTYKTHQTSSTVANTRKLVHVTRTGSAVHSQGMSYTIPSGQFHTTEVPSDGLHATLFVFDSFRGFAKDARILGPIDGDTFTQSRDPAGTTSMALAQLVHEARVLENAMQQGQYYFHRGDREEALKAFDRALRVCNASKYFPRYPRYRQAIILELGKLNRRFGRYEQAQSTLAELLSEMEPSAQSIDCSGELGVVYRHLNRISDAQRVFEVQYDTAKQLGDERMACRAVGNLGMVNYQLSKMNQHRHLLDLAIAQLSERVRRARSIKIRIGSKGMDPNVKQQWMRDAVTWETIGWSRLSLCHSARGDLKDALSAALEALEMSKDSKDSTVIAMASFFCGRVLLLQGRREEAIKHLNAHNGCTPAIAMCKEPSAEHREYLKQIIEAGAVLDSVDDQGYTAIDYAVFNGDKAAQDLLLDGLRQKLHAEVERRVLELHFEAKLRKGYRDLFQSKLRPMLLETARDSDLYDTRCAYADALAADDDIKESFDPLKFVAYPDFVRLGRLPSYNDGVTQEFESKTGLPDKNEAGRFIIFFSYRWINKSGRTCLPDDDWKTQYRRIIAAVEDILNLRKWVRRESVCIWLDHACINPGNPMPGIAALPVFIAQCNATVSLTDSHYYSRAWCSVEALLAQTLTKSYPPHMWYEQVSVASEQGLEGGWALRKGSVDVEIGIREKELTFEEDRVRVLFLERQSRLLG
ncbi:MAG: hypothetical protein Q9170_008218, partial [Blastenia crenularia]